IMLLAIFVFMTISSSQSSYLAFRHAPSLTRRRHEGFAQQKSRSRVAGSAIVYIVKRSIRKQAFKVHQTRNAEDRPPAFYKPATGIERNRPWSLFKRIQPNRLVAAGLCHRLRVLDQPRADAFALQRRIDVHAHQINLALHRSEVAHIDGPWLLLHQQQTANDAAFVARDKDLPQPKVVEHALRGGARACARS